MNRILLFGAVAFGSLFFNVKGQSSDLPYAYGFESEDLDGWSVINAGNGNAWEVYQASGETPDPSEGVKYMMYYYHENAANTYLFSKGLNLKAGEDINLKFDYMGTDFWFPEKMEVLIGTSATVEGQTTQLWINSDITNYPYTTASVDFTVPTDGVYYIAFRAFSDPDQFYLSLDNVKITKAEMSTQDQIMAKLSYYPNPTKNTLNIDNDTTIDSVIVYDLTGKQLINKAVSTKNFALDISALKKGNYMVRIATGNKSKTFKVIKD